MLAQGIAHSGQTLYEAAAAGTVGTETGVTPQHPMTKDSFGFVVGRLDALGAHEGPQRRPEVEEVGVSEYQSLYSFNSVFNAPQVTFSTDVGISSEGIRSATYSRGFISS